MTLNDLNIEIISIKISLQGKDIYVVNCYIPPNTHSRLLPNGKNILENILLHLDYLEDVRSVDDEVILLGDFNLSKVDWLLSREDDAYLPTGEYSANVSNFLDNISCGGFWQTNPVKNRMGKSLVLVFVTDHGNVITERSPTELTDLDILHPPLLVTIGRDEENLPDHSGETTYRLNFRRPDLDGITN
ncbi:hypothetical protein, partial [Streptomyces sp. IBSBF 2390]|uniref:hypothetical protein n=1 Tax=Streptomyces sp. IBSBF 2390 TaxID=2903533 RepID=UPI002FDBA1F6